MPWSVLGRLAMTVGEVAPCSTPRWRTHAGLARRCWTRC
jgi:hypothetical protein